MSVSLVLATLALGCRPLSEGWSPVDPATSSPDGWVALDYVMGVAFAAGCATWAGHAKARVASSGRDLDWSELAAMASAGTVSPCVPVLVTLVWPWRDVHGPVARVVLRSAETGSVAGLAGLLCLALVLPSRRGPR